MDRAAWRIGILHYSGPPVVGGVEITMDHHARELTRLGRQVHIVAGRGEPFHPQVRFHLIPRMDSRHPEVLAVNRELAQGQVTQAYHRLEEALVQELSPLLASLDVCIVHNAMTLHKNLALTGALHRLNQAGRARFIAWAHDFAWLDQLYIPELHPGYPWELLRTPWPGVAYVVVSEHRREMLAQLLQLPQEAIRVITPGVDVFGFLKLEPLTRRLVEGLDLLKAEPLMLLPARVTRRKNIQLAIRITAALRVHLPRATLVVTGPPGPHNPTNLAYLDSLRRLRQELGVEERVHFLYEQGRLWGDGESGDGGNSGEDPATPLLLPDPVVADFYRLADLLLFPSQREGFGMPILEAGLVRLPIFASRIPPFQESAGELAHLFDLADPPARIAQEMADFLAQDPAYRLRRRVLRRFTWRGIVETQILPLIQEVIAHEA